MLTDEMRAEGWLPHDGGKCPVSDGQPVEIMLRSGKTYSLWQAEAVSWFHDSRVVGVAVQPEREVIAYRVIVL